MYYLIINPIAGGGTAKQVEPQLIERIRAAGKDCRVLYTNKPGEATDLARQAASDPTCEAVVSVGGDGTACEAACGLLHTKVPFGIVPAGTGNDFIKTTGTPKDPLAAMDFILSHEARPADFASVDNRSFLNVAGTGFDVQVLDCTVKFKKHFKGLIPYMLGLLQAVFTYRPSHMQLELDGKPLEKDLLICSIANGRYFGGGIPICMPAQLDDGYLDVVMVEHRPRWQIPFYLPALMMGKLIDMKITTHQRCKEVRLRCPGMRFNTDGELNAQDEAVLRVLPGALMLYW